MENEQRYKVLKATTAGSANPHPEITFRIADTKSDRQPGLLPEIYFSEDQAIAAARVLNAKISN